MDQETIHNKLHNISPNLKKEFNQLIKTMKTTIKIKQDITFLTKCKKNNIFPNFIQNSLQNIQSFKTSNIKINGKIDNIINKTSLTLLNTHIEIKHWKLKQDNEIYNLKSQQFFSKITNTNINNHCKTYLTTITQKYTQKIKTIQITKFNKLSKKHNIDIEKNFINCDNWIKNLTNINIPPQIKYILSLGPKFCYSKKTNNKKLIYDLIKDTEYIIENTNEDTEKKNELRGKFTNILTNTINFPKKHNTQNNLDNYINLSINKTKKFIKDNPNILILKADKGNTTVIMEKSEYTDKLNTLISDTNTYTLIPKYKNKDKQRDPTNRRQTQNNYLTNQLYEEKIIDFKTKKSMTTYTSIPPRIYALPKIHKNPVSLRPIVSCINSPSYNLSKFLSTLLEPHKNTHNYNIYNTYQLINHINNDIPKLEPNDTLISLDVQSLFTSIPLDFARDITKALYNKISTHTHISKQLYYDIVDFCLENTYFTHNNTLYYQKEGLPMGDPLSPIIADLVLDKVFNNVIPKYKQHIKFAKKYVDDSIFIIDNNQIESLLKDFNNYHPNLKFTIEYEQNKSIPFLNISIIKTNNNKLTYKHYTKPTYSGRLLHYLSHQPYTYKINCAKNFINQTLTLTQKQYYNEKIIFIKNTLNKNCYPKHLTNNLIQQFFNNNNVTHNTQNNNVPQVTNKITTQNNHNTNNTSQSNLTKYYSLPYIKHTTEQIKKLFKPYNNIKIALKNTATLKHPIYSKIKDHISPKQQSNIIYKLHCKQCPATYIGETSQLFKNRFSQHIKDIEKNNTNTAISEHAYNSNHSLDMDKFNVLHIEKHNKKRLTLEMLYIKGDKNSVNTKQDTNKLSNIYHNIITKINKD